MKTMKNKLLMSVLLLVMCVAMTGTSTFAWLAMTSEPSVSDFELNVTTQEGLMISATNKKADFGYLMSNTDIEDQLTVDSKDMSKIRLTDITPNNLLDGTFKTINLSTLADENVGYTDLEEDDKNEQYLAFKVYFLSGEERDVYIGTGTTVENLGDPSDTKVKSPVDGADGKTYDLNVGTMQPTENSDPATYKPLTKGKPAIENEEAVKASLIDAHAANAMRIAAVSAKQEAIYNPNPLKGWSTAIADFHMANEFFASQYGMADATKLPSEDNTDVAQFGDAKGGDAAKFLTLELLDNANPLFDYYGGAPVYYGEATIYVWLEGTDADCVDGILTDAVTVALDFFSEAV